MNKFIVTTTIYPPSEAILKFSKMKDWTLVIVGDLKTPHDDYLNKENWIYLPPGIQYEMSPELSEAIGWNCIMRRNMGFLYAYKHGADIVASVDDDNIPYDNWGKELFVGKKIEVDIYDCDSMDVFDPMQLTNHSELWHRGYPIQKISESKKNFFWGIDSREILFQADFWNGDPDIDALCRLLYNPENLELKTDTPFSSDDYIPFNSQNTFIDRRALPYYMVLPYIGRVDDIWGGYIAQYLLNTRPIFNKPTTYQKRNKQSVYKNFEDELFGYRWTETFLDDIKNFGKYLPRETTKAFLLYRKEYE